MTLTLSPFDDTFQGVRYKAGMRVYIRYGRWERRSYNHMTGVKEDGISVYRGLVRDGVAILDDDVSDQLIGQGRMVFLVTGKEVGIGSDGEPVLRAVKLVVGPSLSIGCRV